MLVTTLLGMGIGYAFALAFDVPSGTRETPATPRARATGEAANGELQRKDAEIARLQRVVEDEQRERRALEAQLIALQREALEESPSASIEAVEEEASAPSRPPANAAGRGTRPWFDRAALERAGLPSSQIAEVEERFERFEMEKLYLADEAKREGGFRSGPYNRAVQEMTRELRNDLGPAGYDAYLYATGKENRVVVKQVLNDSPASRAGLQDGDVVIRYDGERIFHAAEFQAATGAGVLGEWVELVVERDGVLQRLGVERGPLGVRIGRLRRLPITRR